MKVLLFSDLHAHAFKAYSSVLPSGRNSRLQDTLNVLTQIEELATEEKVDGILFGGDLFHLRPGSGNVNMKIPTFNAIYDAIARLKMRVSFVGLLVGNHDQGNKSGTEHSIYAFGSIVTVMDRRQWYTFNAPGKDSLHVFAVPACVDRSLITSDVDKEVRKSLELFKEKDPSKILLGHLGVDGGKVGSNFVLRDDHLVRVHDLQHGAFEQVFLGDYHIAQKLADNVQYIGATHHHNWADEGQLRGCLIWSTGSENIEFHHLKAPEFTKCPVEDWKDLDSHRIHEGFIRITYDHQVPLENQKKITDILMKTGVRSVEFWKNQIPAKEGLDTEGKFNPLMDQEDMVEAYVETEMPDELDDNLLLSMGHDIFAAAMKRSGQ